MADEPLIPATNVAATSVAPELATKLNDGENLSSGVDLGMRERLIELAHDGDNPDPERGMPRDAAAELIDKILDALLEPTEGMVQFDIDQWCRGDDPDPVERYQNMITAAKEGM